MKIGLVYGFWGQNIGNAFFNLGAEHLLRAAGHTVYPIQDHPAYWTFRNEEKGSYESRYPLVENLDIDLLLLQGPLFTRNFGNIWMDTLTRLAERSIDWGVLSAGFRSYTSEELAGLKEVLQRVPARFISTRDSHTFDMLSGASLNPPVELRNGICSAFFLPRTFEPPSLHEPLAALCFDHFLEPDLTPDASGTTQIGETTYRPEFPERLNRLAGRTKGHAYLAQLADRRNLPGEIEGLQVVRPEHRTNPHLPFKIYQRPNAIASDEPYTYLTVYANAEVTLSDRVHACVAALAYGRSAQLFNSTTKRSALFESVGAGDVFSKTVRIDQDLLTAEYGKAIDFLKDFE